MSRAWTWIPLSTARHSLSYTILRFEPCSRLFGILQQCRKFCSDPRLPAGLSSLLIIPSWLSSTSITTGNAWRLHVSTCIMLFLGLCSTLLSNSSRRIPTKLHACKDLCIVIVNAWQSVTILNRIPRRYTRNCLSVIFNSACSKCQYQ